MRVQWNGCPYTAPWAMFSSNLSACAQMLFVIQASLLSFKQHKSACCFWRICSLRGTPLPALIVISPNANRYAWSNATWPMRPCFYDAIPVSLLSFSLRSVACCYCRVSPFQRQALQERSPNNMHASPASLLSFRPKKNFKEGDNEIEQKKIWLIDFVFWGTKFELIDWLIDFIFGRKKNFLVIDRLQPRSLHFEAKTTLSDMREVVWWWN